MARLWRPMFELRLIDKPSANYGDALVLARTQAHLDLAQEMVEEGAVLLKNENKTLPLSSTKYKSIALFGADATNLTKYLKIIVDSSLTLLPLSSHLYQRFCVVGWKKASTLLTPRHTLEHSISHRLHPKCFGVSMSRASKGLSRSRLIF